MKTIENSILYRLGVYDTDSMPVNPCVRWHHEDPVGTITIESSLREIGPEFDSESEYNIDMFGYEASENEALTDKEWARLLDSLDFNLPPRE